MQNIMTSEANVQKYAEINVTETKTMIKYEVGGGRVVDIRRMNVIKIGTTATKPIKDSLNF
jgi:hypothetical protein